MTADNNKGSVITDRSFSTQQKHCNAKKSSTVYYHSTMQIKN